MGFKRHASYLMLLRVSMILAGAVTSVIIARALGTEGKGTLELAVIVFPTLVSSMGGMGLRTASVYFSSLRGGASNTTAITVTWALILGLVYAGTLILLRDTSLVSQRVLKGLPEGLILLSACLIPVHILWNTADGSLQGRFRFGLHTAFQLAGIGFKLVLVVLFIGLLGYKLDAAIVIYVGAALIPAVLTLTVVLRSRYEGYRTSVREVAKYSLQVWWGGAAERASAQIDSIGVNAMMDTASLGIYSIATLFSRPMLQIPGAIAQLLLPRVASTQREQAAEDSALLARNWIWAGMLFGVFVCVVASIGIGPVFGEDFSPASGALWAMLPGILAYGAGTILGQFLAGTGRPHLASTASVAAFAASVPALLILVPKFQLVGGGLAITTAHTVRASMVAYFFGRTSNLSAGHFLLPHKSDIGYYRRGWRFVKKKLAGGTE